MSDNPKLRDWQGYSLTSLPSNYAIPEGRFLLPICTDARRLGLMLQALAEWKQYDEFPEKYIYDHMIDVLEALAYINDPTGAACEPLPNNGCEDGCTSYPARSGIIRFQPNDPFRTPNLNVGGYGNPPWRTYSDILGIPSTLVGLQAGDAIVTTDSLPSGLGGLLPIPNPLDLPDLIAAGFPRFKVKFSGSGMVELHLLSVPVGGVALVTVDGQINELTRWVKLSTFNLSSLGTLDDLIEAVMGIVTPQELAAVSETIIEIPIDNAGDHYIDVTFLPRIALDDFGFGGGLRKVVFCGDDMEVEEPMLQLRIEDCELRLYSVVGEGESAVETLISGVDLNECQPELTASAQATTLEPSEPATASVQVVDNDFQFEFGIPKGEKGDQGDPAPTPTFNFSQPTDNIIYLQIDTDGSGGYDVQSPNIKGPKGEDGEGVDSVEVTTLSAGSSATASLVDGVLQLGIPRGENGEDGENLTPIDSVEVTTLSAGANATASFSDGILSLGIPRGNTGIQGPQGVQGLQGIQGPPGQDGEDCNCGRPLPQEPITPRSLENVCAGVDGMVDWLLAQGSSDLTKAKGVATGLISLASAFMDVVTLTLWELTPIDNFADFIWQGSIASYDIILAQYADPDFIEEVKCDLYCLIKNSGQTSFTEAIYDQWKQGISNWPVSGITSPNGLLTFGGFGDQIEHLYNYQEIYRRFWAYSQETSSLCESICTDCQSNEWEYTFEGATLGSEWELFAPGYSGFWDSFQEYWFGSTIPNPDNQVGGSIFRLALQLKTPLTTPSYITNIQVGFVPAYNHVGSYQKWYADNEGWALDPDKYEPIGVDSAEYTIDKEFVRVRFDIAADANFPGDLGATLKPIQSITLRGTGTNPFV